ncbi:MULTISPECIES: hypothetical protein [unclassified Stygiolobus]|jgi:uncharacterized phage infection (PIP) family protein YhgE|uniref:hypothetical protein n=1 Tax=unclassified Stygiolobus TaxID=2824672 RepID=UPI0028CCDE00|nr:hypothetical protein [Sulfolobaceae archaeon]
MKFRIDKIPKNEDDIAEIQREVEQEEHHHHHHEHGEEDIITQLLYSLQSLESKVNELQLGNEQCKKEISTIYKVLSKLVLASFTENKEERIKILRDVLSLLE